MKDNGAVTEYTIAREVVRAFRHADASRPLKDRKLFDSCRETLREGSCLCIYSERNKIYFIEDSNMLPAL